MKAAQFSSDPLWIKEWIEADGEDTIRTRSKHGNEKIKFYCSWFCPFAQRAWIALEEKSVS
jgi:glutathionyl-hydroquinone reductase